MSAITSPLYVTAATRNAIMLGGVFRMHDQVGFPIDCCIDEFRERGFLIDWMEALCDCWLNDCLKFDSFVRSAEISSPEPLDLHRRFSVAGALFVVKFPKVKQCANPVDVFCKYVMAKKKRYSFPDELFNQ